jgi:hypothetical protein
VVCDITTWYPAEAGPDEMILSVLRPVAPPALVWYTQVSPTVTGKVIDLGATYEFDVEPAPEPAPEPEEPEPAPEPEEPEPAPEPVPERVPCAAPVAEAAALTELVAPVPFHWLTCGVPALPDALHPARTLTAAPARTVAASRCLLTATA